MKKAFLIITLVLLILALGVVTKLFFIGEPVDGSTVICDVSETDNQVNIRITTAASAIAFTDASLHQEGTTLYITLRKVLVSPLFPSGSEMIWIEKNDLTQIVLGGETVWTAH